jgi:hypothetical protein
MRCWLMTALAVSWAGPVSACTGSRVPQGSITLGDRNASILGDFAVSGNGATGTVACWLNLVRTPVPLPSAAGRSAAGLVPLAWLRRRVTGA